MKKLKTIWQIFVGRPKRAIFIFRISSWFYNRGFKVLGQFFWSLNITLHAIDISPTAKIGRNFRIAHTVGTVIGGEVVIKDNVTIYQNVTLGTKGNRSKGRTYPTIENNVCLYPGCVIVGAITIGENAIVAPNAVVIRNVSPDSTAVGIPATESINSK